MCGMYELLELVVNIYIFNWFSVAKTSENIQQPGKSCNRNLPAPFALSDTYQLFTRQKVQYYLGSLNLWKIASDISGTELYCKNFLALIYQR